MRFGKTGVMPAGSDDKAIPRKDLTESGGVGYPFRSRRPLDIEVESLTVLPHEPARKPRPFKLNFGGREYGSGDR